MASAAKLVKMPAEGQQGFASVGGLLTIEDVAALLSIPVSWVYEKTRRRSANRIPGFRLGKYWRFREADVMAWLERQRVGAAPHA